MRRIWFGCAVLVLLASFGAGCGSDQPAAAPGVVKQAFTHLALINAVMHIIRADQILTEAPEILPEAPGRLAVQFGLELEPADAAPYANAPGDDAGHDA